MLFVQLISNKHTNTYYICLINIIRLCCDRNSARIKRKIIEPELRSDFNEFRRRMRLKLHFRDEPPGFNETPAFKPKSIWHPPKGHACQKIFLVKLKKNFLRSHFQIWITLICLEKRRRLLDLWPMIQVLWSKKQISVCVVVWDRNVYLLEAEKQLSYTKVYRDVSYSENILIKLSETMLNSLKKEVF